jgi:hypothetical protein
MSVIRKQQILRQGYEWLERKVGANNVLIVLIQGGVIRHVGSLRSGAIMVRDGRSVTSESLQGRTHSNQSADHDRS